MSKKYKKLICFFIMLLILTNVGCGEHLSAGTTGVFIDQSAEEFLKKGFDEVKICGELKRGEFKDLSIIFMPPIFPCLHYTEGCSGEYVKPNFIKIGTFFAWKHEVIHYLLDINAGGLGLDHKSSLFKDCV